MTISDLERVKEVIGSDLFPVEGTGKTNSISAEDLARCLFTVFGADILSGLDVGSLQKAAYILGNEDLILGTLSGNKRISTDKMFEPFELSRYEGINIAEKFKGEMDYTDPSDWIRQRLKAHDLSGLHVKDYFKFNVGEYQMTAQIADFNPFLEIGNPEERKWHVDIAVKEAYPENIKWNVVDINNGTEQNPVPYMASNIKAWLNSEQADVPNSIRAPMVTTKVDYRSSGILSKLSTILRNNIGEKMLYMGTRYSNSEILIDSVGQARVNLGKIWLFSAIEIMGIFNGSWYDQQASGFQYKIFTDHKSMIKKRVDTNERCNYFLTTLWPNSVSVVEGVSFDRGYRGYHANDGSCYPVFGFRLYEED